MSTESPNPAPTDHHGEAAGHEPSAEQATRDIAEVPAVEVITTAAIHLMSAAAVKCGLAEGPDAADHLDLDEARRLISALAGLVTASAPDLGSPTGSASSVRWRAASAAAGVPVASPPDGTSIPLGDRCMYSPSVPSSWSTITKLVRW